MTRRAFRLTAAPAQRQPSGAGLVPRWRPPLPPFPGLNGCVNGGGGRAAKHDEPLPGGGWCMRGSRTPNPRCNLVGHVWQPNFKSTLDVGPALHRQGPQPQGCHEAVRIIFGGIGAGWHRAAHSGFPLGLLGSCCALRPAPPDRWWRRHSDSALTPSLNSRPCWRS